MKRRYFILQGQQAVRTTDQHAWARWFRLTNVRERLVASAQVGEVFVSTAFLGLDDQLFQTAVFGGPLDGTIVLYATYDAATAGHQQVVARVRQTKEHRK